MPRTCRSHASGVFLLSHLPAFDEAELHVKLQCLGTKHLFMRVYVSLAEVAWSSLEMLAVFGARWYPYMYHCVCPA